MIQTWGYDYYLYATEELCNNVADQVQVEVTEAAIFGLVSWNHPETELLRCIVMPLTRPDLTVRPAVENRSESMVSPLYRWSSHMMMTMRNLDDGQDQNTAYQLRAMGLYTYAKRKPRPTVSP